MQVLLIHRHVEIVGLAQGCDLFLVRHLPGSLKFLEGTGHNITGRKLNNHKDDNGYDQQSRNHEQNTLNSITHHSDTSPLSRYQVDG